MKKLTLLLSVFLFCSVSSAWGATYYVRTDGGTATQCTGTTDAAYPGTGSAQACAFNHPFWVLTPNGAGTQRIAGGDTLIIDGTGGAEYMIGYGAPNAVGSWCHINWPYQCFMQALPSGPSADNPTRILGKGWDSGCSNPPQLWGTHRLVQILNLNASNNVEVQCLELTDHSSCQGRSSNRDIPCNSYTEPYADKGIVASDSENVLIKNVNIHGLAYQGIHAGRLKDWTLENVTIRGNTSAGWDGDIGANNSSNSGDIIFNNVTIEYSGCGETYPELEIFGCCGQSQGCYGDGLGTHSTGGNWHFIDSNISHNTSDGLDLLYHNGNGTITIKRSLFEGNAGQAVKTSAPTIIENSLIFGNCGYFSGKSFTSTRPDGFTSCRAAGDTVALVNSGVNSEIYNSTITGDGNVLIYSGGNSCTVNDKIISRNNIFIGGPKFSYQGENTTLYWPGGSDGNGTGPCGSLPFDEDYSVIGAGTYQTFKNQTTVCANKGANSLCADPKFQETSTAMFFVGEAFNSNLKSDSPAIDAAVIISGVSSSDYNQFPRGSIWDIGALEYGSVPTSGTTPYCGDGFVDTQAPYNEQCDGTNLNGASCQSLGFDWGGTLTCNSNCTFNTTECSYSGCGNGVVEELEECDDGNRTAGDGCDPWCIIEETRGVGITIRGCSMEGVKAGRQGQ